MTRNYNLLAQKYWSHLENTYKNKCFFLASDCSESKWEPYPRNSGIDVIHLLDSKFSDRVPFIPCRCSEQGSAHNWCSSPILGEVLYVGFATLFSYNWQVWRHRLLTNKGFLPPEFSGPSTRSNGRQLGSAGIQTRRLVSGSVRLPCSHVTGPGPLQSWAKGSWCLSCWQQPSFWCFLLQKQTKRKKKETERGGKKNRERGERGRNKRIWNWLLRWLMTFFWYFI